MNHPPYHLRINKAVDRLLLVNVMRAVLHEPKKCTYYTMGGPFLEDLRLVDAAFPQMGLKSIESDKDTVARQMFHKFRSDIELIPTTTKKFIKDYDPDAETEEVVVFWLDYTDFSVSDLTDFGDLVKKLPLGSIARITLRAEPDPILNNLRNFMSSEDIERTRKLKIQKFQDKYSAFLSSGDENNCVTQVAFARTVQLMVRRAAALALDTPGSTRGFLPVHSVRYNDNTQMLSVTGVIYEKERNNHPALTHLNKEFFIGKLCDVVGADFVWSEPDHINIPALTLKERMKLEEFFPLTDSNPGKFLSTKLGYVIRSEEEDPDQLLQYAKYHREYPNFIRATV